MPVVFFAWVCFTCVIDMIYCPLWSGISFHCYLIKKIKLYNSIFISNMFNDVDQSFAVCNARGSTWC